MRSLPEPLRGLLQADRESTILFYQRGTRVQVEDTDIAAFLDELSRRLELEGGFAGEVAPLGPRPRVFLSYAREDRELAFRVYDSLQKGSFDPWIDGESLQGGDDWDKRIEAELGATDFTLVLHTPTFCRKVDSYVNKEVALARRRSLSVRGAFIIPLIADGLSDHERVDELKQYQEIILTAARFDDDMARVISMLSREYQRRNRRGSSHDAHALSRRPAVSR